MKINDTFRKNFNNEKKERAMPKLVISHSHKDNSSVRALVNYLTTAYDITGQEIRCTSFSETGIEIGKEVSMTLKEDLQECAGVIALLSYAGLHSTYVKYELGAAWVLNKHLLPILGPDYQDYEKHLGPMKDIEHIQIDTANVKEDLLRGFKVFASNTGIRSRELPNEGEMLNAFIKDFTWYGNIQVDFSNADVAIIIPEPKAKLNRRIEVCIERDDFPAEGFLWVAVGKKDTGEYWPKVHLAVNETTCSIIEGGNPAPGELGIWLIGVGVAGHRKFEEWLTNGVKGKGFPPFSLTGKAGRAPGAVLLTASDELIINERVTQL